MDSTAIPSIMFASVVVAACSAIAAAVSAFFSWRSTAADAARTAADTAATSLVLKFRDQYASTEMLFDLRNLRAWHDKYGSQSAQTWQQKLAQSDDEALIVDEARRRVTNFFSNIIDLHDRGLIPARIENLLTDFAGFDLLFTVVEPLERAFSPQYDKARFDKLRKLKPSGAAPQYARTNWVIRRP
jgi:hypothetical protein